MTHRFDLLFSKVMACLKVGDKQGAQSIVTTALERFPEDVDALYIQAYLLKGNTERIKLLQNILSIEPGYERAQKTLQKLQRHLFEEQQAIFDARLAQLIEDHRAEITQRESLHQAALNSAQHALDLKQAQIENLIRKHEAESTERENQFQQERSEAECVLEKLSQQYEAEMAQHNVRHQVELAAVQLELERAQVQQTELAKEYKIEAAKHKAAHRAEVNALQEELERAQTQLAKLTKEHETAIAMRETTLVAVQLELKQKQAQLMQLTAKYEAEVAQHATAHQTVLSVNQQVIVQTQPEQKVVVQQNKQPLPPIIVLEKTIKRESPSSICVFVTGQAGTGKSTLLRELVENKILGNCVVLAPTGIAAINARGMTIHKFFKFPAKPLSREDIQQLKGSREQAELLKKLDAIIIDEVSMVRADTMDNIDEILKIRRQSSLPFGGVRMVFFGDLFQLPPVVKNEEQKLFTPPNSKYKSEFFLDAQVFQNAIIQIVELTRVYRQDDLSFINLLGKVRQGDLSNSLLNELNSRHLPKLRPPVGERILTLAARNSTVAEINEVELNKLRTPEFTFEGELSGEFPQESLPTDLTLHLKVGAQVIFIKNDSQERWVNGTLGQISELSPEKVVIELTKGGIKYAYHVEMAIWEALKYQYNPETKKIETEVIGSFTQYPLKLAWAISIHKSQGLTLDACVIDLGSGGAFAYGQTYVALSRCRRFDKIYLSQPIHSTDIRIAPRVKAFFEEQATNGHLLYL